MPTNLGVLGTQELAPLFQATRGGYLTTPPKFSTELANLKLKFIGNKLETSWYTKS